MTLVERDRPIELLEQLLSQSSTGRGQVALISGGLASGKTALLDAFTDHAAASGALVLSATGSRAERTLQMGVLDQLFRSPGLPPQVAEHAAAMVTVSAQVPDEEDLDPVTIRQSHVTRVHGICSVLLDLARERPLVIAVDDLQFVDGVSLQVLLYLQRRIRAARVMMVFSEWDHRHTSLPRSHAELTRRPHYLVKLPLLSEEGVAQLAAGHLEPAVALQAAPRLHQWSGGNPLLVRALLQDGSAYAAEGPAPGSAFGRAVLSCLHRWEPLLPEVARALAVLGDYSSPSMVRRLIGVGRDTAAQVVGVLQEAGLLQGHLFRHPAARTAVLNSLKPADRALLHLRAASILHEHGIAASEVAQHLVAADSGEGQWAADTLREAAQEALAVNRPEFAVQCLTLALGACCDEQSRTAVRRALMRIEWRANPSAAARHLAPLHKALRAGDLPGRDAVLLVRHLLWQGSPEAETVAGDVLRDANEQTDTEATAELRLAHEWIHGGQRRLPPDSGPAALPTLSRKPGKAHGNLWMQAGATLTTALSARGSSSRVVDNAEHILRSCQLTDRTLEAVASSLSALLYAGRPDLAATWCDSLSQDAERHGATTWQAVLTALRAEIHLLQGNAAEAAALARGALDQLPVQGWGVVIGLPLSTAILADVATGQHTPLPERAVPPAMFDTVFGLRYLHARGHRHLAGDRLLAAVNDFQRCGDLMQERGTDLPTVVPWRSDLAEAHLRMNQTQTARQLVEEELRRPGADNARVQGHALRVLAAASDPKLRSALLRRAVDALQESGDRLELAGALDELSQVHHKQGHYRRARVVARQAAQEARAHHVQELLTRGPLHAEPAGDTESAVSVSESVLSDAERRVATLAALGHTNREISRRLFITISTVEQHLTRVYRKLNVNGRADLPAGLTLHREHTSVSAGPQNSQAC
ncbi:DNA-binding CsgD family transcriptional regulator [Streptomyces sp. V3I8]|uniref:ATP-binding protein n=1 Tax=Streptomyces sp. V3I8 TaxID=3042279 RepID=UPI00278B56A6|nr:LuxR family transcriptional regulator [Streptomyces sp. V3I8]MDQ1041728.1 DNA-binding CsgD family transcriptional regulator [Streptomyces sp. V3I8]